MNASAGRMAALIAILLWQTVLVALVFLLLFLLGVTVANVNKTKAWWKAGLSSVVEDIIETISVPTLWVRALHFD